jgi:AcrR family transcriptional regulator
MEQTKENRKVKYTRKVLHECLLALLKTKPIDKITVTEICKMADINRGTFYIHYHDPFDLLSEIENDVYADILARIKRPTEIPAGAMNDYMCKMLEAISVHKDLFSVLFGEFGDEKFLKKCITIEREATIDDWHRSAPHISKVNLEYIYDGIAIGNLGVIELWIKNDFTNSPEELAAIMSKLNSYGLGEFFN